jgi:antitoxin CptB
MPGPPYALRARMNQPTDPIRKRLLFRSQHRGTKEADALLGRYAMHHAAELSEEDVGRFEALLDEPDIDLVDWIIGRAPLPARHDHGLMRHIIQFNKEK